MARRAASFVVLLVFLAGFDPIFAAHPKAVRGQGGAVASAAPAATAAGIELLEAGGNAVDAAVATALALAVVHPNAGNLGGGGFAVIRMQGRVYALDFRETAPAAATRDLFLLGVGAEAGSLIGPLAAGVPGSPDGLFELHRKHGRLPWPRVLAPAIRLARDGSAVTERLSAKISKNRDLLVRFEETAKVWLPNGEVPPAGSLMRIPALGRALQAYSDHGPKALTEGPVATAVEEVSRRYGGILTAADLAEYEPVWRQPVRFSAFGWEGASMPLPSSGGIILAQTCALLERLQWAREPRFGANRFHLMAETWRRAYADRFLLGDPLTTQADRRQLLAAERLNRQAESVVRSAATPSGEVGPDASSSKPESDQTTHLSVVDGEGNAVALTTTLNGNFGCGLLVPETGILLNNEMDDFATRPGEPNLFGLIQGEANAVGPGKRMLSSMTPTVAWSGETAVMALGAPGGSRIPTSTAQVFLNLVVDDDALQKAVDRPRVHHQWWPDALYAEEDTLSPETRAELERRGHEVKETKSIGLVQVARRLQDGAFEAAADSRGPGAAAVVTPEGEMP